MLSIKGQNISTLDDLSHFIYDLQTFSATICKNVLIVTFLIDIMDLFLECFFVIFIPILNAKSGKFKCFG